MSEPDEERIVIFDDELEILPDTTSDEEDTGGENRRNGASGRVLRSCSTTFLRTGLNALPAVYALMRSGTISVSEHFVRFCQGGVS